MFETFITHKNQFKRYDKSITTSRMDTLLAQLRACREECIVIVAHQITIGELTKRLKLRDPDKKRAHRLKQMSTQYTQQCGSVRKAEVWVSGKFGEGCWLDNCEVQAHTIKWADVVDSELSVPIEVSVPIV